MRKSSNELNKTTFQDQDVPDRWVTQNDQMDTSEGYITERYKELNKTYQAPREPKTYKI